MTMAMNVNDVEKVKAIIHDEWRETFKKLWHVYNDSFFINHYGTEAEKAVHNSQINRLEKRLARLHKTLSAIEEQCQ